MKTLMLIIVVLLSSCCTYKFTGQEQYAGQIYKIDYLYDNHKSMLLYTNLYILKIDGHPRKVDINNEVYVLETPRLNFYDHFDFAIINGCKYNLE